MNLGLRAHINTINNKSLNLNADLNNDGLDICGSGVSH